MLILLVCSGNTCRSPLAAAILRAKLVGHRGLDGIEVVSAGTHASTGSPASEGSYLVALERGLDLSSHRARAVDADLTARADLVLTMTHDHAARLREIGADRVESLDEFVGQPRIHGIPDPYGGDIGRYRSVATLLDELLDLVVLRLSHEQST